MTAAAKRDADAAPEMLGSGAPIVEALDALGMGCAVFDAGLRLRRWNRAFVELMDLPGDLAQDGLSFESFLRFRAERGDYGPDADEAVARRLALARSDQVRVLEHVLPGDRIVESRSTPVEDGGFVALYTDITKRRETELERQASEERAESAWSTLADAIETVDAGVVIWDAKGDLVTCNRRFREFYAAIDDVLVPGHDREDQVEALVARGQVRDAVGREEAWLAERRTARGEGGAPFAFQMTDGRWIRAHDRPTSHGGLVSIHIDITADKERETALAESERRAAAMRRQLDEAVGALGEGFALYDADDRLVLCNERFRELLAPAADILVPGTSYEEILDRLAERDAVDSGGMPSPEWRRQRMEQRRANAGSFQYRTRDGAWIRAIDRTTSDGGVVSIRMDITKLKERERELAESEERAAAAWQTLSDAVEALGEGFAVYDAEDRMVLCNASLRRMYAGHGHLLEPGATYGEILDGMLAGGAFEDAVGREAEWKAARIADRASLDTPFEYRTSDGRWIRAIDRATAEGGTVAIRIDVTERRNHERDLVEKTRLLEATMDSMAQGIVVLGPDLRVRALSDRARELMGLPPEIGRVGAHMADLFRHNAELGEYGDGDIEDIVNQQIVRLATGWEQAFDHVRGDGRRVRISRSVMPDGGWVTTYTDVTAEAEAEAKLERLAELSSRNPNPVVEADARGGLSYANNAARERLTGIEEAGLDHPALAGIDEILARPKALAGEGRTDEIAIGDRVFQRRVVPGQHREGVIVYFNEVTDLRRAEEAQRRSQAEADAARRTLVEAIDSLSEGFALYDADDRLVICNEQYRACYPLTAPIVEPGTTFEEMLRYGVERGEYPEAEGNEEDWIRTRLERHRNPPANSFEQRVQGGRCLRIVENRTPSGGVAGLRVDVTEQKDAEERLRESEERHRGLVEQLPDAVIVHDGVNIMFGNPAAVAMLGAESAEDLQSRTLADITPAEVWPEVKEYIAQGLARGESSPLIPATMVRLDGQSIDVELVGQPFDHRGERYAQVVVRDVTEQRRIEAEAERLAEQLSQAQKMEALGTLAGGIAHDFNNLLGAIIGYADLTADDVGPDTRAGENLSQIIAAGRRAQELVEQILAFSRREQGDVGTVRLDAIIDEVLGLIRPSTPATVEIDRRIGCPDAVIEGKAGQIHQVLMNLCTNAAQAIGQDTGRIAVTLEECSLDRPRDATVGWLGVGDYYVVEVADTGPGMAAETAERMFEPFFTTKDVGEGTGMGLAVVHGIVGAHDGAIDVDSGEGRGTTIRVYLPRAGEPAAAPADPPDGRAAAGEGRILVVDDEPMIADMAVKVLERRGYRVESVYSGLEALAILRARGAEFDLLITDQTMPNLTGEHLIREARRLSPSLPVILSSGYGRAVSNGDAASIGAQAFLAKPYAPGVLCNAVRDVLARAGNSAQPPTESEGEP